MDSPLQLAGRAVKKVREAGAREAGRALVRKMILAVRPPFVPLPPPQLTLEVTGRCSHSCIMCRRFHDRYLDRSHYQDMSEELFHDILDALPDLRDLWIGGIGEPTLHPQLPQFISYAARRVPMVHCFTNGSKLGRRLERQLVESGLFELLISLESHDAKIHESIRIGSKFETVVGAIAQFAELKRDLDRELPILTVTTLAMRQNVRQFPSLMRFVKDLGADKLQIMRLAPAPDPALIAECLIPEEERNMQNLGRLAQEIGIDLNLPPPYQDKPVSGCNQLWFAPFVSVNGDVSACPLNYYVHGIKFGNLRDASSRGSGTTPGTDMRVGSSSMAGAECAQDVISHLPYGDLRPPLVTLRTDVIAGPGRPASTSWPMVLPHPRSLLGASSALSESIRDPLDPV
ncbi:hypothetical protein AMJ82_09325 [candidate division TA06 bacterium SM23_40]|uniref:Radical SAM core domain-containing protein n=2 Tax=Bacteria division TA06 TaxID=1156500 RepID=A0A0S8G632_UNCT6|nr:MAG: hypothetical protein AMJ82_09325 [candidate division TA06 bacterium SM23_40]